MKQDTVGALSDPVIASSGPVRPRRRCSARPGGTLRRPAWLRGRWRWAGVVGVLVVVACGVLPASGLAAAPVVSGIAVSNLFAGVAASVSFSVDDPGASVSCRWQTAGSGSS
ncbi:MAG: hypothetical protein U0R69_17110, partial [Gaiellales bacterium]